MFSDADVATVRHVVQRILVPCVFVIGLLGNLISIYVLTRKRMRCTTNIYLTALAITDIIYLTMAFLLSLKHYQYVQDHFELYWACYGIIVWLCDACAYISIYIAVCFTIERFIAIRYPLKRQTFCSEKLAKRVIAGIVLFCLLSTVSTAFEHTYTIETRVVNSHGRPCNITSNSLKSRNNLQTLFETKHQLTDIDEFSEAYIPHNSTIMTPTVPDTSPGRDYKNLLECHNVTFYRSSESGLAKNAIYRDVWYLSTLFIFVLIPLCLLGTFNCFLIMLVRRSYSLRGEMTNASSIRRTRKGKTQVSSVSQENRVTVTLIAVVLLFIICQLPWAIYLIVVENADIEVNLQAIIGNIFNFLAAINAAANFFLYCVLSDKYRKTVREMILGYNYRAQRSTRILPSVYASSLTGNGSLRQQHVSKSPIFLNK